MNRLLPALMILTLLSGCARKEETAAIAPSEARAAPAGRSKAFLAYEHSLSIDAEEQKVGAIFESAQAACREAVDDFCTVFESRLSTGRAASATLKFRTKPNGIKKIVAALSKLADIKEQSTTAEDLAAPIADAEKKLAMLKDYRSRLESLRAQAARDVDALIKVNRELAQVQSELEAFEGAHTHLLLRVDTEILRVDIRSIEHRAFWKPIRLAASDFGRDLSQGISVAITGIAYLLPWAAMLVVTIWAGRTLWRRRKGAEKRV